MKVKTEPEETNLEHDSISVLDPKVKVKTEPDIEKSGTDEPDSNAEAQNNSDSLTLTQQSTSTTNDTVKVKLEPMEETDDKNGDSDSKKDDSVGTATETAESDTQVAKLANDNSSPSELTGDSEMQYSSVADSKEQETMYSTGSSFSFFSSVGQGGSIPGLDVETPEVTKESESEPMDTEEVSSEAPVAESSSRDLAAENSEMESSNNEVNDKEQQVETAMETSEDTTEQVVPCNVQETETEHEVHEVIPVQNLESVEEKSVQNLQSVATDSVPSQQHIEPDPVENFQTIEAVRSSIHEALSKSPIRLTPPEAGSHLQLSPTSFSRLSQVNLAIRQEPVSISTDVLEIGSNASTPTRDELPSPEDSLL